MRLLNTLRRRESNEAGNASESDDLVDLGGDPTGFEAVAPVRPKATRFHHALISVLSMAAIFVCEYVSCCISMSKALSYDAFDG